MNFKYHPKWKEELIGSFGKHQFTIEMTMGKEHVFFPLENTWESKAPDWAKEKWLKAKEDAEAWAKSKNIPFDVDQAAWVEFHE